MLLYRSTHCETFLYTDSLLSAVASLVCSHVSKCVKYLCGIVSACVSFMGDFGSPGGRVTKKRGQIGTFFHHKGREQKCQKLPFPNF